MWPDRRDGCFEGRCAYLSIYAGFIKAETIARARKPSFTLATTQGGKIAYRKRAQNVGVALDSRWLESGFVF